jgi:hypothetical protein
VSAVAHLPEIQPVEIFELRHDDRDATYWHRVDTVAERGSLGAVLTRWLYADEDRVAGSYRAERAGERVEASWTGDELAA